MVGKWADQLDEMLDTKSLDLKLADLRDAQQVALLAVRLVAQTEHQRAGQKEKNLAAQQAASMAIRLAKQKAVS